MRKLAAGGGLAMLVAGAVALPAALAATKIVDVQDFSFVPASTKARLGSVVQWNFHGPSAHTATDHSGMGLFNSGAKTPGQSFSFTFTAAGSYPVFCAIHPSMLSTVLVKPKAMPRTGSVSTTYTIKWASAAPPAGFVEDLQIARPGQAFQDFLTGQTGTSTTFRPDAGTGVYQFKARLRNPGNGHMSDYSPMAKITVS